jgi:hypothetical protein
MATLLPADLQLYAISVQFVLHSLHGMQKKNHSVKLQQLQLLLLEKHTNGRLEASFWEPVSSEFKLFDAMKILLLSICNHRL